MLLFLSKKLTDLHDLISSVGESKYQELTRMKSRKHLLGFYSFFVHTTYFIILSLSVHARGWSSVTEAHCVGFFI